MAQYDVYKGSSSFLYVDVQTDYIDLAETRIFIPLDIYSKSKDRALSRLNPIIQINNMDYMLLTQTMGAYYRSALKDPITNIAHYHDDIRDAIDFLLYGY